LLNAEDALSYAGKAPRLESDHLQLGTAATHRLYETSPPAPGSARAPWEDPGAHWVFLAATTDDEFSRFCVAAGCRDVLQDARFATMAARQRHDDDLAAALDPVFRTRPAQEWEDLAVTAGVGCVRADAMSFHAFLHRDPQARALGMAAPTSHPKFGGAYWRPAPALGLSGTPCVAGPYCEVGEHTRAILRELGYDDDTIDQLGEDGVVAWPEPEPEPEPEVAR
jgi:crotonobetainyl-CoA:carnitine CoA-transferase CaiB-like acyl-CoA transferase